VRFEHRMALALGIRPIHHSQDDKPSSMSNDLSLRPKTEIVTSCRRIVGSFLMTLPKPWNVFWYTESPEDL